MDPADCVPAALWWNRTGIDPLRLKPQEPRDGSRSSAVRIVVMKRVLVMAMLLGGCSVIATRSSPREPARTCRGYLPAIVDGAVAAVLLGLTIHSIREHDCGLDGCHTYDPTGLYVLGTAVMGSSTFWGVAAETSCRHELSRPR